LLFSFIVYN